MASGPIICYLTISMFVERRQERFAYLQELPLHLRKSTHVNYRRM